MNEWKFPSLEYAEAVIDEAGGLGSQSLNSVSDASSCQADQFIMLGTDVEFLAYPMRSKAGGKSESIS